MKIRANVATSVALAALALLLVTPAFAQSAPGGPIVSDITSGRRDYYKIAVPELVGDGESGRLVTEVVSGDLGISGWFKVLDPRSFVANLAAEGTEIVVADWRNVGAEGVVKGQAKMENGQLVLDMKLYQLAQGNAPVLSKTYRGPASEARAFAHAWSNEVVKAIAGEDGFFDSKIAFSASTGPGRKDIFVMDYDGANLHKVTHNDSQNVLPAWSPDGREIVFTSFVTGNPDLFVVPAAGGKAKRISGRTGVNMGAAFSPDGKYIACTLSQDGNSEIYRLDADGGGAKRLTDSPFIDSSPAWSPDGQRLAFVSNRHGSPQLWLMSPSGSQPMRLTRVGNYNQEPAWCPSAKACPRPTIAFTARDENNHFDIFLIDVVSGQLTRVTENQGDSQHPSWAPNGRALVVANSRGGIWIITADGKQMRQVYKGAASTPTWGPAIRHHAEAGEAK